MIISYNILKWLSGSLILLVTLSCTKDRGKLAHMKKGKYEMINTKVLSNGQKDTIHCVVYGPKVLDNHYFFTTEIKDKLLDKIDLTGKKRKDLTRIRYYSENFPTPGYFEGKIDEMNLTEDELKISYKSSLYSNPYGQDTIISGFIQFKWLGL